MAVSLTTAIGYLNETLTTLGYGQEFQIDASGTDAQITAALQALAALAPTQKNAIMEQMNLVVQNRNFGVMFDAAKNKFRSFVVNMTETGFGIEDLFHELIEGGPALWDDKTNANAILTDLVSYDTNKIDKAFHTDKFDHIFKTTVDTRNYDKVFTTIGVVRYVDTKLANLQWSAEVYLMQVAINTIKEMISKGEIVFNVGNSINDKAGLQNTVEKIKATVDGFLTPCSQYNYGALSWSGGAQVVTPVVNMTDSKDDIFIISRPDYMERLKVQGYANAFNLSQFELEGRILYVPMGTSLGTHTYTDEDLQTHTEEVQFVVLDRRAVLIGIRYWLGSSEFIPNVHRINHWLNIEGLKGYNTFFNAVAFTGEELGNFLDDGGEKPQSVPVTMDIPAGKQTIEGESTNLHLQINGVDFPYNIDNLNNSDNLQITFFVKKGDVVTFEPDTIVYEYNGESIVDDTVTITDDNINIINIVEMH